jgi:hypothetical protein
MSRWSSWIAVLGLLLLSSSTFAQSHAPKLIDVHVHYDGEQGFLEKLLDKLNAADGLAFLLTTPQGFPQASKFIREHPDRLIGFGDIKLDDPNALSEIDRFHQAGFRGLGEITTTQKNYDDPAYWPLYDRADKYHMILLFHTGIVNRLHPEQPANISFDRSRVTRLDLIARHWPRLTIIGAHLGNPDYAEAGEIGRWDPNLFFDVSGSTLIKKKDDYGFFRSIFWWTGVVSPHTPASGTSAFEKIVFGSDVFGGDLGEFDLALQRYHEMLDACQVDHSAQEKIFSGTMWRILQQQQTQDMPAPR